MKAKLLSLFLLACMLITAIPVMAQAEDLAGTSFEENAKTDYDDMYVKDGLTSLFLAYENDIASATKAADGVTWKNLVAGKGDATFVGSAWAVGANGGIGRTVIYGTKNADGSFTAHNDRNTYWTTNTHKLDLGLELLPKDDFTLEYVAFFPPIYSVDAVTGDLLPIYEIEGATYPYENTFVDRIGFMQYFTNHPAGHVESSERGSVRPQTADSGCTGWAHKGEDGVYTYSWGNVNFEFDKRDVNKIASYTVMRDETAFTESGVAHQKAVYYHMYNADIPASTTNGLTYTTVDGKVANGGANTNTQYFYGDDDTDFYLSYRIGVTYYAIRIYNRNLITSERIWNLGIDVLNYYEIASSEELIADEAQFRRFVEFAAKTAFESDATAYAATKATLQAKADEITLGTIGTDVHDLYVKEGLANVFTTFGEYASTANLSTGKWTDIISGKTASFGSVGHWRVGENGGVGFNIFRCGAADTDSDGYFDACDTSIETGLNYTNTAIRLDLGLDLLPVGDFTVEYLAKYKPVYMYDASQADKVARDKNGVKMQVFDYNQTATCNGVIDIDQLGWFTSYSTGLDSAGTWNSLTDATRPAYRGAILWQFNNPSWYYGNFGNFVGGNWSNAGGMNKVNDAYHQNDVINTYTITLDETLTVAEDGTRTTTGLFSLYRGATFYNSNENVGELNSTAKGGGTTDGGYHDIDTAYTKDQAFRLSMRRPTDFFTVRIYTRALTEAEMLQNHAVDAILYYGLDVSGLDFTDEDVMPRLAIALKNASFETDATAKAATKAYLQKLIDTLEGTFAYAAQENLTALFTTYLPGTVDLAAGTWTDIVGGAKASLGTKSVWKMDTFGGVGFNVFYGTANADGTFNKEGYNLNTYKYYQLNLGIGLLSEDDFTVEYNVRYKPVYVYDADESDNIAKDASGKLLESYVCLDNIPDGAATAGIAVDRFGWFSSWTNNIAGNYSNTGGRGGLIWLWHAPAWGNGNNGKWVGANWNNGADSMSPAGNPFTVDNEMHTHGFYVDETRTVSGATTVVTALVGLYRDVAEYRNNANALQSTANGDGSVDGGYLDRPFNTSEYFYLSTARPTEFFTIRVYNKTLTMDERAQNHFIDLLNYYGVEAPADALRNTDALVALGNTYASMKFELKDASVISANKATLENAIAALKKTVTVTLGDKTIDTIEVLGETLTLPALVDGKAAIAWTVSGVEGNKLPGTEIAVTDGMTITPVLFTIPETTLVPSVKVTANAEDLGLRFTAALWRADYVVLANVYGAENLSLGMLITPDAYVAKAGAFTREALTAMVAKEGSTSGAAYVQINADGFYSVGDKVLTLAGTLNNFHSTTLAKDPAFAAIAFIDVDANGDGVRDFTLYGLYNASASATVKATMAGARDAMTDTQKGWVDNLLSRFGA